MKLQIDRDPILARELEYNLYCMAHRKTKGPLKASEMMISVSFERLEELMRLSLETLHHRILMAEKLEIPDSLRVVAGCDQLPQGIT